MQLIWILLSGAFVRLEFLAWSDKLAVDDLRPVNQGRRWATIMNDYRIQRLSDRLEAREITPGQFLHQASWCIAAGVHHGLRLNRNNQNDSTSSDEHNPDISGEEEGSDPDDLSDSDFSGEDDSDPDDPSENDSDEN